MSKDTMTGGIAAGAVCRGGWALYRAELPRLMLLSLAGFSLLLADSFAGTKSLYAREGLSWAQVPFLIATGFIMSLVNVVMTRVLLERREARIISVLEAGRLPIRTYALFCLVSVCYSLSMVVGIVLLVVPGIYAWGYFSLARIVVLSERSGVKVAFRRSKALVRGHYWIAMLTSAPALVMVLGNETWVLLLSAAMIPLSLAMQVELYARLCPRLPRTLLIPA